MSSYESDARAKALLSGDAPTKQQIQEGYNTDLLNEPPAGASKAATPGRAPATQTGDDASAAYDPEKAGPAAAPTPFWKSSKGKIVIFILALAAIAAIVGGAVGGTVGTKKNSNNDTSSQNSTAASTGGGAAGDGGDSSTAPGASVAGGANQGASKASHSTTASSSTITAPPTSSNNVAPVGANSATQTCFDASGPIPCS